MMKKKKDVFEQILKDFEKKMEEVIQTIESPKKVKKQAFSIRIQPGEYGPEVFVQRFDGKKRETQHLRMEPPGKEASRKVKKYIEPVTKIIKKDGYMILETALPAVKRGDVEITQLKRSIEIRAYSGQVGFFSIFAVPKGYQIIKDEMNDGRYRLFVQSDK